jgi:recombination protein RecT
MNAPTTVASPIETYRQKVLPPEKANDLWRALPAHIKPAVFERNLVNALMQNPALTEFHPSLVYREVSKAAGLGLLLDPQLGEGYIVAVWNGKAKRKEPQLRIGYKGMCKLARQTGNVTGIYAHEVCARDKIECHLGAEKRLIHVPDVFSDRGQIIGYYAVIKFKDGSFDFEPMTVKQCRDIRDRTDSWKAFQEKKIYSTPWATDESEMSKKTALRRLLKRQEQSPEVAEALRIEDEADMPEIRDVTPVRDDGPPAPPPRRLSAPPAEEPPLEEIDQITGEIVQHTEAPPTQYDAEHDAQWLRDVDGAFSGCESMVEFGEKQNTVMAPGKTKVSPETWAKAERLALDTFRRVNQTPIDAG